MKKVTLLVLFFFYCLLPVSYAQTADTVVENGKKYLIHEVVKGQTLYGLSRLYQMSVDSLIKDNPGTENGIQIGQKLKICLGAAIEKKEITHVVQKGENLYYISRKYGVNLQNLYDWNPGLTDRIDIGQKIKIIIKQPAKSAKPDILESNQDKSEEKHDTIRQVTENREETTSYISEKKEKKVTGSKDREQSQVQQSGTPTQLLNESKPVSPAQVQKEFQTDSPAQIQSESQDDNPPHVQEAPQSVMQRTGEQKSEYNVFLLLPLYTQNSEEYMELNAIEDMEAYYRIKSFNFLQFYEAALLALEDLNPQDVKVNFYVKDVNEQNNNELKQWISEGLFEDADLIIGPFFRTNFITMLSYIQGKNITMVNPFTINIDGNTAPLFRVTASYTDQAKNLADYVCHNYKKAQFILVNNHGADEKAISAFKTALYLHLQDYPSILIREINYAQGGVSAVTSAINSTCENFIIAFFEGEISVTHFVQSMGKMKCENVSLVVSSKWRKYDKIENEYFASLKTHYMDQFFVDYTQAEVIRFIDRFREAYNMEPTLDQFAFQGYDITYFFVKALITYGNGFGEEINQMEAPLLSTRFRFHKNSRLTYENSFNHLYKLSNDYHYVNALYDVEIEPVPTSKESKNKRKK